MTVVDDRKAFDVAVNAMRSADKQSIAAGIFDDWVAQYAIEHELNVGWMRGVVDSNKYVADLEIMVDSIFDGAEVEQQLAQLAQRLVDDMQQAVIDAGLVDTGTMLNSIRVGVAE